MEVDQEIVLKPKRINLPIKTKNFLGISWGEVNLRLVRIDEFFFSQEQRTFKGKTNSEGKFTFKSIPEGAYVIQASKEEEFKRIFYGKTVEIREGKRISIRLPILFGWLRWEKRASGDQIKKLYSKYRADKFVCFKCREKYESYADRFKCRYCKHYFCSKHKVPESHNCSGESPHSLPSAHRVIYSGKRTKIITD